MCSFDLLFIRFSIFGILFNCILLFGQKEFVRDSLSGKNFKELAQSFYEYKDDTVKAKTYANAYLIKAKVMSDSVKIADAFYFLAISSKGKVLLSLNDSIIHYTKNIKENKDYPLLGFLNKGDYYYVKRNFDKALENYLLANNHAKNNLTMRFDIKYRLSLLKVRYGDEKEGLELAKEVYFYSKKQKHDVIYPSYFSQILFGLADAYIQNNQIDSSYYFCKKGIELKDKKYINYFNLLNGVIEYHKENYQGSIKKIKYSLKVIRKKNDLPNIAYANHYIGLSYFKMNDAAYIKHFKTVDSVFQIINDLHPDLRSSYEYLIDYYKEKKKLPSELEFVNKLIDVDKVIFKNYNTVGLNLIKKYDSQILLREKDIIITILNEDSIKKKYYLIFICIVVLLLFCLFLYQYNKNKIYKKKFNKIIKLDAEESKNTKGTKEKIGVDFKKTKSTKGIEEGDLGIPKKIINEVLDKLDLFEKNKEFTSSVITLSTLAKKLNTNTNYLSKIINTYKERSFSNYLNHLRINFVVQKLKTDSNMRKYTIKAISEEVGFKNSESFSKGFYKINGVKPSYFIKELNKLQ